MRQGVSKPETPRDRAERDALDADLFDSPVAGKPLRRRLRNFRAGADVALRALGGALEAPNEEFARAWRQLAQSWRFADVNDLIERHNRHFPVEARLPMNPRTGDFVHVNGRPYTRQPLDADWILERFPPDGQTEWNRSPDNS